MLWMGENKNIYTQPTQGCSTTFSILIRNCNWIFFVSCSLLSSSFRINGEEEILSLSEFSSSFFVAATARIFLANLLIQRQMRTFLYFFSSLRRHCVHTTFPNEIESEESWKFSFPLILNLSLLLDDDDCEICTLRKKRRWEISIPNFSTRSCTKSFFSVYYCAKKKKSKIWHWKASAMTSSFLTPSLFSLTHPSWISNAENFALFLAARKKNVRFALTFIREAGRNIWQLTFVL